MASIWRSLLVRRLKNATSRIRTPIFEHYEVISRSVGGYDRHRDQEMYDFYDKGTVILRYGQKELAPVVRSYVENKLFAPEVQKAS